MLLAYSVVLLVAVLVSALAHRTVLSTAVLFLAAGFVLGDELTGVVPFGPNDEIVSTLAELAAPRWSEDKAGRIVVESKDDIRKRLGRSTDNADAV